MKTRLIAAAILTLGFSPLGIAQTFMDDARQSGFSGDVFIGTSAPINADGSTAQPADPFMLTGIGSLTRIDSISITLTIFDGNTGPGEVDRGNLTLGLNGINTGIALNGFLGAQEITLTITGTRGVEFSDAVANAILASIQMSGGVVNARILDRTGSALSGQNDLTVPANDINGAPMFATLSITQIPEPATVGLLGAGLLLVLAPQLRRFRRNL